MTTSQINAQMASLTQHVELNKAGWWDKSTQALIRTYLYHHKHEMTIETIVNGINKEFSANFDKQRVRRHLQLMVHNNEVLIVSDKYKIPETERQRLDNVNQKSKERDSKVKNLFLQSIGEEDIPIAPEVLWQAFINDFLHPVTQDMGAKMYELLTGENIELKDLSSFEAFLDKYDEQYQPKIREGIINFFEPSNPDIRKYVIQLINAIFLVKSSNLSDDQLSGFNKLMGKNPSFKIFVDTNFLFYLLDLDESDFKETADLLKSTIKNLSNKANIKLYVLPTTMREAREKLSHELRNLRGIKNSSNLSKAALSSGYISGIRAKYFEFQAGINRNISAEDYFTPYIENMLVVIRDAGLELYNDKKAEAYLDMPKVSKDVGDQIAAQERFNWKNKKNRAALEHDCGLWHFTNDIRPLATDTPIEAEFWIITTDFGFINYDKYKRRQKKISTPICILPTSLIQMLQLWIPRTAEFEKAMLGSIRPLLSDSLDPQTERTTLKIIETLSKFEDINHLSPDILLRTMTNETLRHRISTEKSSDNEHIDVIKESIITELQVEQDALTNTVTDKDNLIAKMQAELNAEKSKTANLQTKVNSQEKEVDRLLNDNVNLKADLSNKTETLNEQDKNIKTQAKRLKSLEQFREDQEVNRERNRFLVKNLSLIIGTVVIIPIVVLYVLQHFFTVHFIAIFILTFIITLGVTTYVKQQGEKRSNIAEWNIFILFKRFYSLLTLGLTFIIGIFQNAAWDFIKSVFDLNP